MRESRQPLSGTDLHNYLKQHTVETDKEEVICPKVAENTDLKEITNNLSKGYDALKKQNSKTLATSIDYGEWLDLSFEAFRTDKRILPAQGSWKEWLRINVGICESYARKLRTVSRILSKYPRFKTLGLPFLEVYQRRKQIQNMLKICNSDVVTYWQQSN